MSEEMKLNAFPVGIPEGDTTEWTVRIKFNGMGEIIKVLSEDGKELSRPGSGTGGGHTCSAGTCHRMIGNTHYCVPC